MKSIRTTLTAGAALAALFTTTSAQAQMYGGCDERPGSRTYCTAEDIPCMSDSYDASFTVEDEAWMFMTDYNNMSFAVKSYDMPFMVGSDDPAELHAALDINTTFDADHNRYLVEVNMEHLNDGTGMIVANSNGGQWSSLAEVIDYQMTLLGIPYSGEDLEDYLSGEPGSVAPPDFVLLQKGNLSKVDGSTGEMSLYVFNDLALDTITGVYGTLEIAGVHVSSLFFDDSVYAPPGLTSSKRYPVMGCRELDTVSRVTEVEDGRKASQCSYRDTVELELMLPEIIKRGGDLKGYVITGEIVERTSTILKGVRSKLYNFQKIDEEAVGVRNGDSVRFRATLADEAFLDSQFFNTSRSAGMPVELSAEDVSTLNQGSSYSGVCSEGFATIARNLIPKMQTAVGMYTVADHPYCQKAESRASNN